jgi:hypothetical protein
VRTIAKALFFSLVAFFVSLSPPLLFQTSSESLHEALTEMERRLAERGALEPSPYLNAEAFKFSEDEANGKRVVSVYNLRDIPSPRPDISTVGPQEGGGAKGEIEDFLVNDDIGGECDQMFPDIARHLSGSFVVTWEDMRSGHWDIYAQRYDSAGTPIDSNILVNDDGGITLQMNPAIAMDSSGNFIIVWEDGRSGDYHLFAQRYDSSGSPIGSNFIVSGETRGSWEFSPAIAMHRSGSFVISWTDERYYETYHWDIYALRYSASGSPLGTKFRVNDDQGFSYQQWSAVAIDTYGNFIITWEDRRGPKFDAYAQRYDASGTPLGSNFKVNDVSVASECPAVAMDVLGNCVICWYDSRDGHRDIYAQRFDASGTPLHSNFRVNDDIGPTSQMLPDISMHDSGSFIITWMDGRAVSRRDIYAQRYDSSGTPIGSNFSMNDNVQNTLHWSPAIDMDELGNFVITWEDYRNIGGPDTYGQRCDSSGTLLGANFKANDDIQADQTFPVMASDGSGDLVIGWLDFRNRNADIYSQRYNSVGTALGSNFKVNDDSETAHQYSPATAGDVFGNFVVTWEDWRYASHDIYAQRYSSFGGLMGSNFRVNDDPGYADQESPSVAMGGPSSNFVITWDDYRNGDHDIYAQRYDFSGAPLGTNFRVNDDVGSSDQRGPATGMDGSGCFVIAWDDHRNGNCDIYAQRYDPAGNPSGANFTVNDDPGTAQQHSPAVSVDGSGNFIITWEDERNGDFDIYAQRYDPPGTPVSSNFKVNDDAGIASQANPAVALEDSGSFVIIWEDCRDDDSGDVYAQRYDSSGSPVYGNYLVSDVECASFPQLRPAVAVSSSNISYVWEDKRREKSWDIYAKVGDWVWPHYCGDANTDGLADIGDIIFLINYFFLMGSPPDPLMAGDVNLNGEIDVGDVIYLINYLFLSGTPPCS